MTIGQYLRPSRENLPVVEYVRPEVFERHREVGRGAGLPPRLRRAVRAVVVPRGGGARGRRRRRVRRAAVERRRDAGVTLAARRRSPGCCFALAFPPLGVGRCSCRSRSCRGWSRSRARRAGRARCCSGVALRPRLLVRVDPVDHLRRDALRRPERRHGRRLPRDPRARSSRSGRPSSPGAPSRRRRPDRRGAWPPFPLLWMATEHARSVRLRGLPLEPDGPRALPPPDLAADGVDLGRLRRRAAGRRPSRRCSRRAIASARASGRWLAAAARRSPPGSSAPSGWRAPRAGAAAELSRRAPPAQPDRGDAADARGAPSRPTRRCSPRRSAAARGPARAHRDSRSRRFPAYWDRSATLRQDLAAHRAQRVASILFNDVEELPDGRYYNVARLLARGGPRRSRPTGRSTSCRSASTCRCRASSSSCARISTAIGEFTRGGGADASLRSGALAIGIGICYEIIYPSLARREVGRRREPARDDLERLLVRPRGRAGAALRRRGRCGRSRTSGTCSARRSPGSRASSTRAGGSSPRRRPDERAIVTGDGVRLETGRPPGPAGATGSRALADVAGGRRASLRPRPLGPERRSPAATAGRRTHHDRTRRPHLRPARPPRSASPRFGAIFDLDAARSALDGAEGEGLRARTSGRGRRKRRTSSARPAGYEKKLETAERLDELTRRARHARRAAARGGAGRGRGPGGARAAPAPSPTSSSWPSRWARPRTRTTPGSRSTPAPAAPSRRTGRRCSCACTCASRRRAAGRPS